VRKNQQRPLAAGALQPRDKICPIRILRESLVRDAFLVQRLLEVFDDLRLVYIIRVDLDQSTMVPQYLGPLSLPVDSRRQQK
jgi:hypothetical protein